MFNLYSKSGFMVFLLSLCIVGIFSTIATSESDVDAGHKNPKFRTERLLKLKSDTVAQLPPESDGQQEITSDISSGVSRAAEVSKTEKAAVTFMRHINEATALQNNKLVVSSWNFQTNITDTNKKLFLDATSAHGAFVKDVWKRAQEWKEIWPTFTSENLKRQFKKYSILGAAALQKEKFERFSAIVTEMKEVYSTAKICDYHNATKCDLSLDPELEDILETSQNYDELVHVWKSWRDVAGKPSRELFTELIELLNEAAVLNNFSTSAEMWTDGYESENFENDVENLYAQLKPLYEQLHAYTRRHLRQLYGEEKISKRGPIPAHLTGNMWAQSWVNLYDILVPYPNKTSVDVTDEMVAQGYTPLRMFQRADDFFASLGLERVPPSFFQKSVIEKPEGRDIVCHASAWDFYDGKDVRIKQCTAVTMKDFATVHHEMGHVQFYLQYKHLPAVFRRGANPGFHEAVGDVLALSVNTPKHLQKIGLLQNYTTDDEADINFLMRTALRKIAFLPFSFLIDKYRWEIMRGEVTPANYTKAWWTHRFNYQGLKPPIPRSEADFDPAAKYHVSANVNYVRYFVANILQFQFHKSACLLANEYDPNDPAKPLHRCDIYQSKEAGEALRKMLQLGSSVHPSVALKAMTGSEAMDASALREYFRPLENWLIANNKEHGEFIGWEEDDHIKNTETGSEQQQPLPALIPQGSRAEGATNTATDTTLTPAKESMTEEDAVVFMRELNEESALQDNKVIVSSWNYQTNLTEANKNAFLEAGSVYGVYEKDRWNRIQEWKESWPTFTDESLKRQFKLYSVLGTAALPKEKYERLIAITTEMEATYSTANICDYQNSTKCDLSLNPDIENILKTSQNYNELVHAWKSWRDVAGKPSRKMYAELIELSNEAAVLNNFSSSAELWTHDYESETFENDVENLYAQLKPLYEQLHAYVRRHLREVYGEEKVSRRGPIPAHITGNMWAQKWENLYGILAPYPNKTSVDVTDEMVAQGYTPLIMFQKADDFFASLGLERVPQLFWEKSVIEKPDDRDIVCHASAWGFANGKDFRIKQCTAVTMEDFTTVHHEMGHVQYDILYKDLPNVFQSGANPGFHEAVGDVLSLSVSTPKHLQKVGLLHNYIADDEADINFLMQTALSKIAFLPFGLLIDKYRWEIMRGKVTPDNYTKAWWTHRYNYQGIKPPIPRTEEDFDPAAKYHVSANIGYIRYFVASILQFQFHKAACLLANEYDPKDPAKPLHRCDIYQSIEAGKALRKMLKLGSSVHPSVALKAITGSEVMDASALREYFRPLENWLIADNQKHGEFIGWEGENDFMAA